MIEEVKDSLICFFPFRYLLSRKLSYRKGRLNTGYSWWSHVVCGKESVLTLLNTFFWGGYGISQGHEIRRVSRIVVNQKTDLQ